MNKTDVLIVGAGPAGIFTAIEMIRHGTKKKIVIVEKGEKAELFLFKKRVGKRACFLSDGKTIFDDNFG